MPKAFVEFLTAYGSGDCSLLEKRSCFGEYEFHSTVQYRDLSVSEATPRKAQSSVCFGKEPWADMLPVEAEPTQDHH